MKRSIFLLFFLLSTITALAAQTGPETEQTPLPESVYEYEPIRVGDQFMRVGLGADFPLFFQSSDGINTTTNLKIGGTGSIGYSRFVTSRIALGGEINFAFNSTLGQNILFYLPVLFKASYVFVAGRFHIPISVALGMAFQSYNSVTYFGMAFKPEVGVYFQYNPDWSFGISSAWNILPQLYKENRYNRTAHLLDVLASVRFHF
ncbi:hypothetical protein K7I13_04805 [Brucepastera parasyntrophica]|uniref:TP0733 family outer membrane beta-barrel protein n=1 Tax=Brucepastera parasyntrophica TaxID=2880008 RepID=UPI00210ACAE0|nr:hypothetical protein [Brucepastera parasyntrophica]ULQ60604.1 hypothetical protein K7I13_04805 [Brucepastera parasyntrophica]